MKIALPNLWGPDSFTDNVVHTLRAMGHEVRTPGWRTTRLRRLRDRWEKARAKTSPGFLTSREAWLIRCAREWRPDVVLALTTALKPEVLAEVRRAGVRHRVAWWGDPPANMTGLGLLTPEWDLVCLKDPDGVAKLACVGIRAVLVHEAMNPDWHRPVASQANDEVVVAGNYYGYRQAMVKALKDRGVSLALYGPPMPLWALPELRPLHRGRYIVKEEKSRVFGEGLACLNSTSMSEGNSLNCRAFEIAGVGGLQLIEDRPILRECFEPGREVLAYRSVDEIVAYLERARREPGWARRIREAGARRAATQHTYRHRLDAILGLLGGRG